MKVQVFVAALLAAVSTNASIINDGLTHQAFSLNPENFPQLLDATPISRSPSLSYSHSTTRGLVVNAPPSGLCRRGGVVPNTSADGWWFDKGMSTPVCWSLSESPSLLSLTGEPDRIPLAQLLAASSESENIVVAYADKTRWQVWDLFDKRVEMAYASDSVSDVPEPTSLALFALGILALGWFRRKEAVKAQQTV